MCLLRMVKGERPKHHLIGGNQHVVALYNRVSGELMVLGFVAFVVWVHELPSDSQSDSRAESLSHSCQPHSCQPRCLVCASPSLSICSQLCVLRVSAPQPLLSAAALYLSLRFKHLDR